MWTKITKSSNRRSFGRAAREVPAVMRARTGAKRACLVMPSHLVSAARANIYSDGNGKLAYSFDDRGEYNVHLSSRNSKSFRLSVPYNLYDRIPYGTTDAVLTRDGDMWVLDLSQFDGRA